MKKTRLLIGSTICQTPRILKRFLESLKNLDLSDIKSDIYFIDDNQEQESKEILNNNELAGNIFSAPARNENYNIDEKTHYWTNELTLRVANLKNQIIEYAIKEQYDYLFLIDSDLIINPKLIKLLMKQEKDIISEIFWTAWHPNTAELPNVWMYDTYDMAHPNLPEEIRNQQTIEFLKKLKSPGVYEVGGLGACTLFRVSALKKGLSFSPINNLSFWGEDRWFCIRAMALGISLYVDTHYPAEHLYRESYIK